MRWIHRLLILKTVDSNRVDLNGWFRNSSNAEHCPSRLGFPKILCEYMVHLVILAHVFQVDLDVDHMIDGQSCRLYHGLHVFQSLLNLVRKT